MSLLLNVTEKETGNTTTVVESDFIGLYTKDLRWLPKIKKFGKTRPYITIDYPIAVLHALIDYSRDEKETLEEWATNMKINDESIEFICDYLVSNSDKKSIDIPNMRVLDILLDLLFVSFGLSKYSTCIIVFVIKHRGFKCYETIFRRLSMDNFERIPMILEIFDSYCHIALSLLYLSIDGKQKEKDTINELIQGKDISLAIEKLLCLPPCFPLGNVKDLIYKYKPELIGTLDNNKLL